nr:ribonuclease H-like domain, reverse transcriptase, RNA-dependent DNA polymerase [Tanacetum cinerariifolium]
MKAVPLPLFGDYTSLSDNSDLDESQMSYGIKSSTSSDSKSVSNDFVSCNDNDKSSEVNTNDFAFSDSSVKSLEPKPNDSTSCASTSSVSTSEHEAEFESNENASSVSKLCFVCGSGTHLIKDCDFYKKQMANKTVGIGVNIPHARQQPVLTGKPKVVAPVPAGRQNRPFSVPTNRGYSPSFAPQVVLLRTGKVNIPHARQQPVLTGKPKVVAPVPAGRQNRPFPVPTNRGYSPSVYTGYPRTIVDLIHIHTDDNVADLLTKAFDGPSLIVQDDGLVLFKCSTWTRWLYFDDKVFILVVQVFPLCFQSSYWYVVPTGRVVVPTGRLQMWYDNGVAVLRALVRVGDKTTGLVHD